VKESVFAAALLAVAKFVLQQLDHLAKQDALRAQCSLKHVELDSKHEQFNLFDITLTNSQFSISNANKISALSIGLWGLLFMS